MKRSKKKPKFELDKVLDFVNFDNILLPPSDTFKLECRFKQLPPNPTFEQPIGRTFSIPLPDGYPNDGKEHDLCVKYNNGNVQYSIDGKLVS